MSVNKFRPHIMVLPEDDANRELAHGFQLEIDALRQMQVLGVAGGWGKVLDLFKSVHVAEMDRCPYRLMILLIDLDGRQERLETAKAAIPAHLVDRVFVLGVWSEPEKLKGDLNRSYEQIGFALANDCRQETEAIWGHRLLRHNAAELERLRNHAGAILFCAT